MVKSVFSNGKISDFLKICRTIFQKIENLVEGFFGRIFSA